MAIKVHKPTTSGQRGAQTEKIKEIGDVKSANKLLIPLKKRAGRSCGKISMRHRGGGSKRKYRLIDFKQDKYGVKGKIVSIEYDPNRSSTIALVVYQDGEKRYIIAPKEVKIGDTIESGENVSIKPGNRMLLKNIPLGTKIYNIELNPKKGGQLVRSAGNYATVVAKDNRYIHVMLPSKEIRRIFEDCHASIGSISNPEHFLEKLSKAGTVRRRGRRPKVRGKAMAPSAHPHGGGEGVNPIGLIHPKTPWGKPTLGFKTRKKKKPSNKMIVRGRKR